MKKLGINSFYLEQIMAPLLWRLCRSDVRKGCAFPRGGFFLRGYAPSVFLGEARAGNFNSLPITDHQGRSPKINSHPVGKAQPFRTSLRQSRTEGHAYFRQALLAFFYLCLLIPHGFAQNVVTGTVTTNRQYLDQREVHETYPLTDGGTISVSNTSGYIRVTSWNEPRVELNAVKRSRNESDWQQVAIEINARPTQIEIRTVYPRGRSNSTSVDYELKVPRTAILSNISCTSGDVTITGPIARLTANANSGNVLAHDITGDAKLTSTSGNVSAERIGGALVIGSTSGNVSAKEVASRLTARATSGNIQAKDIRDDATASSSSGNVRLENLGGRASASTASGSVNILNVSGDVSAHSVSDNVTVQDARGHVRATTVSGNVTIRQAGEGARANSVSGNVLFVKTQGRLEAETVSGDITLQDVDAHELRLKSLSSDVRYQGKLHGGGTYEFQSFSGDVMLTIPADSEFNLAAQTFSGSLNTEFPLQLSSGTIGGRGTVRGVVGKGGAQVTATTFNGDVTIKKQVATSR